MESSTEFLEIEHEKISKLADKNNDILNKIKQFISLLDKVECSINDNMQSQLNELENMNGFSNDTLNIFKIICQNTIDN